MSRRSLAVIAAVAAATLALSACSAEDEDTGNDVDRPLRVAVTTDASTLDPVRGSSGADQILLFPMYDTLVSYEADLEPKPGLAESWEYLSPTELQFTLREGVKFHDGTPFDAEAVKYNVERAKGDGSQIAPDLDAIGDVRVDDEFTVTLLLSRPDAALLMVFSDRAGMMVSPTAAEAAGGDLGNTPVGTGGWKFVEWRRGEAISVELFDDYWDTESARVPAITFTVLTDPKTRMSALLSGQQDIVSSIPGASADTVEEAEGVSLSATPGLFTQMVYINTGSDELGDPRVRRALSLAIDRQSILESGYFGFGEVASGYFPQIYWAATPKSATYDYDPDEARRLLEEAGRTGLTFDMTVIASADFARISEILKEQWAEVGVTVNLLPREVVQQNQEFIIEKKFPAMFSQLTSRPDPAMIYRVVGTADGFNNPSEIPVPGLDEALADQDLWSEKEDRRPGLDRAAQAIYEHTQSFSLVHGYTLVGLSDEVEGFEMNLLGKPKLVGVTIG
ncbi:ABC transporter substrate-binding protein [Leucobacter komagatae]|uniref:ABC transporter substrate-binding protein n=1 Tax=Leucobacter komagatae TaxID=55969 RepID=UPI0018DE912A|nr:ABC transporter substrate-binding protein [Leucobacter komagatae]